MGSVISGAEHLQLLGWLTAWQVTLLTEEKGGGKGRVLPSLLDFWSPVRSSDRNGSCLYLTNQQHGHMMKKRGSYLCSEPTGSTLLGGERRSYR